MKTARPKNKNEVRRRVAMLLKQEGSCLSDGTVVERNKDGHIVATYSKHPTKGWKREGRPIFGR